MGLPKDGIGVEGVMIRKASEWEDLLDLTHFREDRAHLSKSQNFLHQNTSL
jgi:hypothetical protein